MGELKKRLQELMTVRLSTRFRLYGVLGVLLLLGSGLYLFYHETIRQDANRQRELLEIYSKRLGIALNALDIDLQNLDSLDRRLARPFFREPLIGNTAYPFVVKPSGEILLHFFREGDRLPIEVLEDMARSPQRRGTIPYTFTGDQQRRQEISYYYSPALGAYVAVERDPIIDGQLRGRLQVFFGLLLTFGCLAVLAAIGFSMRGLNRYIDALHVRIAALARGEHPPLLEPHRSLEGQALSEDVNNLIAGLGRTVAFAREIGDRNLDAEYTPLGPQDVLGNALLGMRESIREGQAQAARQKEEESARSWANSSMALFGRILREHSDNIAELTSNVLQQLVSLLNAAQGGFYILEEGDEGSYLTLSAAFAYDRQKFLEDRVELGEGLVGTCAVEREMIYLKEIPEDYCTITSGLGDTPPRELLLLPLKTEEQLYGVIEMASLESFSSHEVSFAQALSESIASTLMTAQSNQRRSMLLQESQAQRERMLAQEETMRQNLEEVRATQEEMARRQTEDRHLREAIRESFLYGELDASFAYLSGNESFESLIAEWQLPLEPGASIETLLMHGGSAHTLSRLQTALEEAGHYPCKLRIDGVVGVLVLRLSFVVKSSESGLFAGAYLMGSYYIKPRES